MTDDELLALLGEHERANRTRDAERESIARGAASADVVNALAAEDGPDMARAIAPFGPDAEARILARIADARAGRTALAPTAPTAPTALSPAAPVADLAAARARRFRRIAVVVGPLAAAAAVVLALRAGAPAPDTTGDALPAYALTVSGGTATVRGAHEDRDRIVMHGSADETFDIVARPATVATHRPVAQAFVWKAGAAARPLAADASIEVADTGAIRLRGSARALADATELRVVVSNTALSDEVAAAMATAEAAPQRGARVLRISITRE